MDNFGFLNKKELSYILNNKEEFGDLLLHQVEEYCDRNKFSIQKTKTQAPSWQIDFKRISLDIKTNKIVLSKTEESKKKDNRGYLFIITLIGILLLGIAWEVFWNREYDFTFWYTLLILPFLILAFVGMMQKIKTINLKNNQQRALIIFKSLEVELVENGNKLLEQKIKAVNLFWTPNDNPTASLELKTDDKKAITIDEDGNSLELLITGNEISKFLNKKMNIFSGNSPTKDNIEL